MTANCSIGFKRHLLPIAFFVTFSLFSLMLLLDLNEGAATVDWATQAPVWQLVLIAAGIGLIFPALYWVSGGDIDD